jgi:hypothetical protein
MGPQSQTQLPHTPGENDTNKYHNAGYLPHVPEYCSAGSDPAQNLVNAQRSIENGNQQYQSL